MTLGEFDLIARYFQRPGHQLAQRVVLGIGDDCALLQPAQGQQLAVSSDMLVEGRHFFSDVDPMALGHKALAVNLSDLAACGAAPLAFSLALALPTADATWLGGFTKGLFALADAHGCDLIGGDTTRGPLNICITVFGQVPSNTALLRSGAQSGDEIWVSGTLGEARLALQARLGRIAVPDHALESARQRLDWPTPRVALGQALRGLASAAIDLSDGLAGDLGHLLRASDVGATLHADAVSGLLACPWMPASARLDHVMSGGDDYELLFTAAPQEHERVLGAARQSGVAVTRIGSIEAQAGLRLTDAQGQPIKAQLSSFDHFL